MVLTLLAILALGSAAVATKVFLAAEDPVTTDQDPGKNIARTPADRRFGAARAKDPRNSTTWGVRLYYNNIGETCALVGVVDHGRLGQLQNGTFKPLPQGASGECHNMTDHIFIARRTGVDPVCVDSQAAGINWLMGSCQVAARVGHREGARRP